MRPCLKKRKQQTEGREYIQEPQSPASMQTPCSFSLPCCSEGGVYRPTQGTGSQAGDSDVKLGPPCCQRCLESHCLFFWTHTCKVLRDLGGGVFLTSTHTLGFIPWAAPTPKQGKLVLTSELTQQRPPHLPPFAFLFSNGRSDGPDLGLPRSTGSELSVCRSQGGRKHNASGLNSKCQGSSSFSGFCFSINWPLCWDPPEAVLNV